MSNCNCEDIIIEVPVEQIVIEMTPEGKDGLDGKDGNGIESIELFSTEGLVKTYRITFTDGTHFDFPMTDGVGIESLSLLSESGLQKTYRILFTDGSHFDYVVTDGADGQTPTLEWGNISGTLSDQTDLQNALNNKADIILSSATGDIVSIADAGAYPATALSVDIEPVQDLSNGDPSPDNVCPITGHTSAVVTRTGKNLYPKTSKSATTVNGITFTPQADGSIKVYGTSSAQAEFHIHNSNAVSVPKDGTYTISCAGTSADCKLIVGGSANTSGLTYAELGTTQYGTSKTQALTAGTTGNNLIRVASGKTIDTVLYPMLEPGSSASAYAPYIATQVTIDLDGTRYGGTVDLLTGVLTVDRASYILNANMGWRASTSYPGGFYCSPSNLGYKRQTPFRCSHAKSVTKLSDYILGTCYCDNSINLRLMESGSTVTDWQEYLSNNNIQIVYELATPITYQLTPQQLSLLKGDNTIWADTGDVSVGYRADTKLYIDGKLADLKAELQALILEN